MSKKLGSAPWLRGASGPNRVAKAWRGKEGYKESKALEEKGIPISVSKPLLKKLKKVIDKRRTDVRKYRKEQAKTESGKRSKTLNKAQERLETADEYRAGMSGVAKKAGMKPGDKDYNLLIKPYDKVIRRRSEIRTSLMHPDKVRGRKPNYKGGLVTGIPKLARKGF